MQGRREGQGKGGKLRGGFLHEMLVARNIFTFSDRFDANQRGRSPKLLERFSVEETSRRNQRLFEPAMKIYCLAHQKNGRRGKCCSRMRAWTAREREAGDPKQSIRVFDDKSTVFFGQ